MTLQPKPEPGSPPGFHLTNNNTNFEEKTIPELVNVLRAAFKMEVYDTVEAALVSRDNKLRTEILQLLEKVEMERLTRLQCEEELRKRDELCEKGKRAQESYEALLKEVKVTGLVDRETIGELRKKNTELECEVQKLKEKLVGETDALDVIRKKNGELEYEILELRTLKEKWVDDSNALVELRSKIHVLESDKIVLAGLGIKNGELEEKVNKNLTTIGKLRDENSKLADEKRKVETLLESLNTKFRGLHVRVSKLEDDSKLLTSGDVSVGVNNEGEPSADRVVRRNEDSHHSLGVIACTQLHSKGSKDAQGALSASGKSKLEKDIEIINLDDDDDDDRCISQGMNGKKSVSGISVKTEYLTPSSSTAFQPKDRLANVVDMVKRRFRFIVSESSSSTSISSDDSSYLENLTLRSTGSRAKKKKT
ncbi:uncharacterized protein [Cicer arietinum]|uniref:Uncharacterized protein LOC101507781 isoform X2 n=1 Tax=Cicer arietinum TaxID=3827 RepID=A0A3Q7Y8D9_CICAR|nr:uncharacterized protein LOC101507781 isoform X2 [Cicer arietinum]